MNKINIVFSMYEENTFKPNICMDKVKFINQITIHKHYKRMCVLLPSNRHINVANLRSAESILCCCVALILE